MTAIPPAVRDRIARATQPEHTANLHPALCFEGHRLLYATRGDTWRAALSAHFASCRRCNAYHRAEERAWLAGEPPYTPAQEAALDAELTGCREYTVNGMVILQTDEERQRAQKGQTK